jgi:hypothetical protein
MSMWNAYICQNPDTPARTLDGEAIVITPDDSVLHTLNDTATFIWDRADGTRTLQAIADEMLEEFEVDAETLQREAISFVEDAVRRGLLLASDQPSNQASRG